MKTPDVMSIEMEAVAIAAPQGSSWKHAKSGGEYAVIGHCFLEADAAPAVLYALTSDGEHPIWARAASEFLDGRFTRISLTD
ncbi:hypothetical protein [Maritimibacter alkaliphilus]|uniref:hypothetical protein n=1 Tax=Maritimibacter alkaliphilus TaxID=404236 RepID=UPI001C97BAE9|nr:hypothetical protein [Maritimibacter alkaliphilus]MBY6091076.1 hypothetical protein [Maritimibacter alkaliphilus]